MSLLDLALQYAGRGWCVFPCHTTISGACSCGKDCGKDAGKHPRIKAWQQHATADTAQIIKWWKRWPNANIGVATGSGLVVIDIDGQENLATLARLKAEHGPLPETLVARTGRGLHLYFKGDLVGSKMVEKLLVRGEGGYVLAPGSLHASGTRYQWVKDVPLAAIPAWFIDWLNSAGGTKPQTLNLGAKPAYLQRLEGNTSTKAANALRTAHNPLEENRIRSALAAVPASCQRDPWLHIGMALHDLEWERPDGTNIGFEIWDQWSATCPEKYSLHDVETRWRSFGKPGRAGITLGTLYHIAREHGWEQPAPRAYEPEREVMRHQRGLSTERPDRTLPHSLSAAAAGGAPASGTNGHHALPDLFPAMAEPVNKSPLIDLNSKYSVIGDMGGKCMVLGWVQSKVDASVHVPSFQTFRSFTERFANKYVVVRKPKGDDWVEEPAQLGTTWLKWPQRKTFDGIDLEPGGHHLLPENVLNLWQGFAIEPRKGSWPLMRRHIAEVLARNNLEALDYIMRWAAWKVQHPGERAEVALVFKGKKGAGKGTFANAMRKIFGQHGLQIWNSKHLVGSFNGHLRNCLLLYADEAFWAGDKQGESVLKGMLTEPSLMIEQKGVDATPWKNRIGMIMTANADWVVPASHDERRYAVFDVSADRAQSDAYFKPLYQELNNGGLAAMLYDLQHVELGDWHPRRIPQTEALQQQKLRSLQPLYEWFEGLLSDGLLIGAQKGTLIVPAGLLLSMAKESVPRLRDTSSTALGRFLGEVGCSKVHGLGGNAWQFQDLAKHRALWTQRFGNWHWSYSGADWIVRQ